MAPSVKGTIIAMVIGVAVATFPLYGGGFIMSLWTNAYSGQPGQWATNYTYSEGFEIGDEGTLEGNVTDVDYLSGLIYINGVPVTLKGEWSVEANGTTQYLGYQELIELIQPGDYARVGYEYSGRWGAKAFMIELPEKGLFAEVNE